MNEGAQSGRRAVLLAASSHTRLRRASAWLHAQDRAKTVIVLAASLGAGKELVRQTVASRGAAFGWRAITLTQLAAQLAERPLVSSGLTPVARLASEAIIARVVQTRLQEADVGRYSAIARTPGFVRALTSTVLDLRLAGVAADRTAGGAPDLAKLQRAYEAELSTARLADWPEILRIASQSTADASDLLAAPTLLLDVPVRTELEARLVRAVIALAPDVLATIPKGDERTTRNLHSVLGTPVEDDGEPRDGPSTALTELCEHLFAEQQPKPASSDDDSLIIASAPGESRECVEIARRILLLGEQGVRFDQIAILLRSPEEYRPHLEEALARAKIPTFFERGIVRPDPTGRAFLAILRCALEGLSAHRFAEYLSLAQVPDAGASGGPPVAKPSAERWAPAESEEVPAHRLAALEPSDDDEDCADEPGHDPDAPVIGGTLRAPRRWERLLVNAAVIGGIARWRRRLAGLEHQLQQSLRQLDDGAEADAERLNRDLSDLRALREYALPLLEELQELPSEAMWDTWLDRLGGLASRALRRPERVLGVLSELVPMGPVGPVGLSEVLGVLGRHLLEIRIRPKKPRYGSLFVAAIEAARGLAFDVVFVPGLAEKLFPRKIVEDPILLDRLREPLSEALLTNSGRLVEERLALRIAVGAARRQVVLSFPRIDPEQARPRVPSFYALEAKRAAEGRLPLFGELTQQAETVTPTRFGWPAPAKREVAIDDSEYDLAVLESLVDLEPDQTLGAARYLLNTNPHLARALRFRARRWLGKWTAVDGLLKPGAGAKAALAPHQLDQRSFSPTALQNYAACPYRFFLYTIHKLAPHPKAMPIDEMDALQRGALVHEVQFELFGALRDAELLPVTSANLNVARALLDKVLDEVAAKYRDDLAPAIERVWEDGVAAVRADLREWLRRASEDESGFVPWRFELAFGLGGSRASDPNSVEAPVELACGLRLRGSIDLIERSPAGELRVTDHKTGRVRVDEGVQIDGGKSLQPLLYALAVENLFPGQKVRSGRLYFCTAAGGFAERVVPLDDDARAAADVVADTVGKAVSDGAFPAAPAPGACEWCDYRVVCGPYEELRTRRKPSGPLTALRALRKMP